MEFFLVPRRNPTASFMVSINKCGLSTFCGCLQNPGQMFGNDRLPPLLTEITQSVFSLVTDNVTGERKIVIVVPQNVVPLQTNRFRPTSEPSRRLASSLGSSPCTCCFPESWGSPGSGVDLSQGSLVSSRHLGRGKTPRELGLTPSIRDVLSPGCCWTGPVHMRWPQAHRHC